MSNQPCQRSSDVIDAIFGNNAGRDPERLAMKYAKMEQSPFIFLRGAWHLFYDHLPDSPLFGDAPLAWCCGDLHFENFGSYKGDNRLVYFYINDYDEAALFPTLQDPKRASFLDKRTIRKGRHRRLRLDGVKALPASDAQKKTVTKFLDRFAARQPNPKFFQVLDIGRRIAGAGSLGVERYVVLVEGKGSPDSNYLLDIKEAKPSAMVPHLARLGIKQPTWSDEASRVVTVQNRMQAVDHAFLHAVKLDGLPCTLRGLQPSEDRVAIGAWGKKLDRLKEVVATMGRILAWDQLRASGRSGSASADELIAFAQRGDWVTEMLDAATEMTMLTQQQWKIFTEAMSSRQSVEPTP